MTGADLDALSDEPGAWGAWRLNPGSLVLSLRSAGDWICQVSHKSYVDDRDLSGLVRALDDVLRPQARLCSFGKGSTLTRAKVAELVAGAADRWPELTCRTDR